MISLQQSQKNSIEAPKTGSGGSEGCNCEVLDVVNFTSETHGATNST